MNGVLQKEYTYFQMRSLLFSLLSLALMFIYYRCKPVIAKPVALQTSKSVKLLCSYFI